MILDSIRQLGLKEITVSPNKKWARSCCPFHNDHHPSFSISLTTGQWTCFSHCGTGTWAEFLLRFGEKATFFPIATTLGPVIQLEDENTFDVFHMPEIDTNRMTKTFQDRGFTFAILKPFGIGYDDVKGCMAIPVHDEHGKEVGVAWRQPPFQSPRYLYSPGLPVHNTVYGLDKIPDMVNELYFFEGPLNAVWMTAAHAPSVAFFGSNVSQTQLKLVTAKHPQHIVLGFDNDEAGRKATEKVGKTLAGQTSISVISFPPELNDVQEVPLDEILYLPKKTLFEALRR